MLVFIIGIIFFYSVFVYFRMGSVNKTYYGSLFWGFVLYFIVIGLVTFNNDWLAYEWRFENNNSSDLLYYLFYKVFNNLNLKFKDLYIFNQVLNAILLLNFFRLSKASKGASIIILISLALFGSTLSILLRYSTAFLFFINGAYYFSFNKKQKGITFFTLAVLAHFGACLLILIYFSLKPFRKYIFSTLRLLILAIVLLLIQNLLLQFLILLNFGNFLYYIEEGASSVQGGIMASLPVVLWFFSIVTFRRHIAKKEDDETSDFLYQFSLIPFVLFFVGLTLQIVLYRYIEPFAIIWGTYFVYELQFFKGNKRFHIILLLFVNIVLTIYLKYFLPFKLVGHSEWYEHYEELLKSNLLEIF